jgi:hypothetical protein
MSPVSKVVVRPRVKVGVLSGGELGGREGNEVKSVRVFEPEWRFWAFDRNVLAFALRLEAEDAWDEDLRCE